MFPYSKFHLNVTKKLEETLKILKIWNGSSAFEKLNYSGSLDPHSKKIVDNKLPYSTSSSAGSSLSRDIGYFVNTSDDYSKYELITKNIHNTCSTYRNESNTLQRDSVKRKNWCIQAAFLTANEILMTERTYNRELEVISNFLSKDLSPKDSENLQPLFLHLESLLHHHGILLRDLEQRMLLWKASDSPEINRVGDVLLKHMVILPIYEKYFKCHMEILKRLNELYKTDEQFRTIYRSFEHRKICYIPINYFLLKPLYRLLYYQTVIKLLMDYYSDNYVDKIDCQGALTMLNRTTKDFRMSLKITENFVLLCEIERDLSGFEGLAQSDRQLIRQGTLLKHSKTGLQQLMFFLFSDMLIYTCRSPVSHTFRLMGHMPLRTVLTETVEHNTFVIFSGQKSITVSAGTLNEKMIWLHELKIAVDEIKSKFQTNFVGNIKSYDSSDEALDSLEQQPLAATNGRLQNYRSNLTMHVCWSRGITINLNDHLRASESQMSGYLLRKYKNSSGWQRLWTVLSSFCLFFYKNYQDDSAIASISLLGCSISNAEHQDFIQRNNVFKVAFKNHVYFFCTENDITFNRWLTTLKNATVTGPSHQ